VLEGHPGSVLVVSGLKVALVVILVLLLVVVALRVRKLRRDEMRALGRKTEPRLMTPPESPYQPSKGFRLLEGDETPSSLPPPARPRLEPDQKYVFSDFHPGHVDVNPSTRPRHDEEWALSRSAVRPGLSFSGARALILVVVIVLVVAVVGYYARDRSHHNVTHVTTTTVPIATTTTTTTTLATTPTG
jgi:hypothetical protein